MYSSRSPRKWTTTSIRVEAAAVSRRKLVGEVPGSELAERSDDLGDGDLVDEDVVDLDMRHRPGRQGPQRGRPDIVRGEEGEQVRLQALEALVQPGEARPRPRRGKLGARRGAAPAAEKVVHSTRRARR